ncbi:phosphoribosylamine--glycine ligase [Aliifodinibius sp. S!AR15-10]|uniref:phosphoribosylamine--glycine ligase n=1 Tax=Aliifodinibius sp. S!AR15-10 TaxID=2950437 RepID=UPI00285C776B|nr:phosphoribosylamine--glycine ligase [Aliifodinibius sp. S!AR15-10]MDR8391103.1 phosphoribosylamine--glycine ligase [Aliifodinibius sp. S!AR15-10]
MNVLLLGSGGREHAMAWSISKSPKLDKLFIAPGNPGTAQVGENVDLSLSEHQSILEFIETNDVALTVVGPEKPLVEGLTDFLEEKGHKVFGPSKTAAQLEGSKKFANNFMEENNIPTAEYVSFQKEEFDEALSYVKQREEYPVVLKADGLAGGKGVFICETEEEVEKRLVQLKEDAKLSDAAETLVIEEFMEGEEASVFVISDGNTAKIIHNAQDHKRIGEGDTGLNTGGMGAYSPAPVMTKDLMMRVEKEIVLPTISAMLLDGNPYKGILYCGLMITDQGPKVVEYNCRFGDPECQAILPSLKTDLLELLDAASSGELEDIDIEIDDQYRCCVVMASGGYPKAYEKGKEITGIEDVSDDVLVFHAGTALKDSKLVTEGGRVLNVVGSGASLQDAIKSTYAQIKKISFEDAYYRSDIGVKGLAHLED